MIGWATMLALLSAMPSDETIVFHHGPAGLCFPGNVRGICADYVIVLDADGRGTFERRGRAASTPVPFHASRKQTSAFRHALQPYRPAGDGGGQEERCHDITTEGERVDIRWQRAGAIERSFHHYFGCDADHHAAMQAELDAAPRLLPISMLIDTPVEHR